MRYIKNFGLFWYDFIIGDDWKIAAGVVITLILTALIAHQVTDKGAGIVIVLGVLLTMGLALRRSVQGT